MKKNLLVTVADKNYIDQAKQLFSSAYLNGGWDGDYMLLSYGIEEEDMAWFKKRGVSIYKCNPLSFSIHNAQRWPIASYAKLYPFTEYFKNWETIVLFDADIIIRHSLNKIKQTNGFSSVRDDKTFIELFVPAYHKIIKEHSELIKEIKRQYDTKSNSFNGGFFAFDSAVIKPDTFSKLIYLQKRYGIISAAAEEAILNMYFYKNWNELPITFNLFPNKICENTFLKPSSLDAIVMHFNTPEKPWHSAFYLEWQKNLAAAEKINFTQQPPTAQEISYEKTKQLDKKLRGAYVIGFLKRVPIHLLSEFDRNIGFIGILLKRNLPFLYNFLKKFV